MTSGSLARSYLRKASARLRALDVLMEQQDYSDVVREAQEVVELALKGILRQVGVDPPKQHDVGALLVTHQDRLPASLRGALPDLATISKDLRHERELAFYGDTDFIPTEEYDEEDAKRALGGARRAVEVARSVIFESGQELLAAGLHWSYREVEGGEPALVFLHAFPLQKAMWEPVLAALEGRARAVAPDLPGFGGSASLTGEPSMDAYADAIAGFLDALGIRRAIFCGLSMGGYLVFALWRRHRERVGGLILADTRAGTDSPQARQGRYDLIARLDRQGARAAAEQFLPNLVGPTTRGRRPELLEHLEGWILANSPQGMAAAARAMAERPDSTDLLAGIDVPALVVVGEEDGLTPPEEAERMAGAIPGATLARIPQAGHLSALEQPGPFNSVLIGFLDRFRAGG